MAILSKEQFNERIRVLVGDDTSDESLQLIEDMTDTYASLETPPETDVENWEEKYNALDTEWRTKYKERFFSTGDDKSETEDSEESEDSEENENITIDELFEEV